MSSRCTTTSDPGFDCSERSSRGHVGRKSDTPSLLRPTPIVSHELASNACASHHRDMDIDVVHKPEDMMVVAEVAGETVGRLHYRESVPGTWTMYSTVVEPKMEGNGIGTQLAATAVAAARGSGKEINPTCWFVSEWLTKEREAS